MPIPPLGHEKWFPHTLYFAPHLKRGPGKAMLGATLRWGTWLTVAGSRTPAGPGLWQSWIIAKGICPYGHGSWVTGHPKMAVT